jgi:tRNA pseudouridine38-40 synthase
MAELLDARLSLEVPIAGRAAVNADAGVVARLEQAIADAVGHQPGTEPFNVADSTFHAALAEASGNQLLFALTGWILEVLQPSLIVTISPRVDAETILAQHRAILRAVRRRQRLAAEKAMAAHIDIAKPFTPFRLTEALNGLLKPQPVAILACEIVPDDWHARFSCVGRDYLYRITNRRAPLALEAGRAWRIARPLDVDAMHEAAQRLVGRHDFTTFRSAHCQAESPIKALDRLDVRRDGDHVLVEASARSFLHHQVRSIVGCLKMVGAGRWPENRLGKVLAACDRSQCAALAPPCGLYLAGVDY